MRGHKRSLRTATVLVACLAGALAVSPTALAAAFRVNSTADTLTASPNCDPLSQQPTDTCTLRDALTLAGAAAGPNTIGFNIATGVQTISLSSPLPPVPDETSIDGSTQPGYNGTPLIVLDGNGQSSGVGLDVSSNATINALDLIDFSGLGVAAIRMHGGESALTNSYVGVDPTGVTAKPNTIGVLLAATTTSVTDSVVSGNAADGIVVDAGPNAGDVVIVRDKIGIGADNETPVPNKGNGVHITMDGLDSGDAVGNTDNGANVIAFNGGAGVLIEGAGRGLLVRGNSIHDNAGLGIDLAPPGPTPSPGGSGPDEGVNAPFLTSAVTDGTNLTVSGFVPVGNTFAFDIYASGSCDPSGYGEGRRYLGTLTTSPPFNTFNGVVGNASPGEVITAVTVDESFGATSEFSRCLAVNSNGFLVTSASNTPGSTCDSLAQGGCTLAQAITAANAGTQPATIDFDIAPGGLQTIVTGDAPLPGIVVPTTIDGGSQPGVKGAIGVYLDGNKLGHAGLDVANPTASGSVIRGLGIGDGFATGINIAADNVTVAGNYIGTDATGAAAAGNGTGIFVNGNGNTIGGSGEVDGNVISGSSGDAIVATKASGLRVTGNLIGTNAAGTGVLGNDISVNLQGGADDAVVSGNVMAGNADVGLLLNGPLNAAVSGNFIGTDANGKPFPNISQVPEGGAGIRILSGTGDVLDGNQITSNSTTALGIEIDAGGNTIKRNTIFDSSTGIRVAAGNGTTISQNSIDANAGLGIDLVAPGDPPSGVTPNDPAPDADTGPNGLQNYPSGLAAQAGDGYVRVTGSLVTAPGTYTVEFFASNAPDPSGFGEGARYLGSSVVITDGNGTAAIDATFAPQGAVAAGDWVTATATDGSGSTSEFSKAVQANKGTFVTITPEADATVAQGAPNTNFGALDYSDTYGGANPLCLAPDVQSRSYTLLRFDLSSIPAGATVAHVQLQMTSRAGYAQDGDPAHWLLFVADDSWTETGVTWNNRPADGVTTVGDPGTPDIRTASTTFGAADVFRNTCSTDLAGDQTKVFPSTDDGFPRTVAAAETDFRNEVVQKQQGDDKLSLELWTPNCANCPANQQPDQAYWARYWTREATDPAVRPKLVVEVSEPTASVTLGTGDTTSVESGAARVPLANVPPSAFFNAISPVSSTPIGSIPIASIPIASIPIASIPIGSIPIASIGLDPADTLLGSLALSTIPLTPPASWASVLAGTPFATQPLQTLTLGQVLANATVNDRLKSVPIASINLAGSALGSLTPTAVGLGATKLSSLPIAAPAGGTSTDPLTNWCGWLHGPPLNCTDASSLGGSTVMSAALEGAPIASIPIASIPIASIPIASIPIASIPLGSIPIASITVARVNIQYSPIGSIPIASIPIASVPIASIPIASITLSGTPIGSIPIASIPIASIQTIFNCTTSCPTTGTLAAPVPASPLQPGLTLAQLVQNTAPGTFDHITLADLIGNTAPATLHNYTIGDLIKSIPPGYTPTITLADVLALVLDPGALSWENFDLAATPVQPYAANGSNLAYNANFELDPNGGPSGSPHPAKLSVKIPAGFLYKPGSSKLLENGDAVPDQPGDPTISSDGRTLTWSLDPIVGSPYTMDFDTLPELDTGPAAATASVTPDGGTTVATSTPANVQVTDTFEPNNAVANATPLSDDSFYLSHITSASDVDYYSFPVPAEGTRVTFRLSHLPADYDLVVYGPDGTQQQLRPPDPSMPPIDGQPLTDTGFATTHATDALGPQTLNDVTLVPGLPVYGISTLRGTQDDDVVVISNGETGNYTVQVSGFDGATSQKPYMLRVETTPQPVQAPCSPRTLPPAGAAPTQQVTTLPGQTPADVNTLFVVNDQQLQRLYPTGSPNGAATIAKLNATATLTGLANTGFPSAVVHVDSDSGVRSAYNAWNACPTDVRKANDTVKAIGAVLDSVRGTYPNVEYVVLVGGDDALPFARIEDYTTAANENGYAETFPTTSALNGSMAASKVLTDDPYATTSPVPFLQRQLYVPDLVSGRLVETPANINAQLDAFIGGSTPGHLQPVKALTTGYDFLSDGATAVSSALGTVATGANNATSINDTWTRSTLIGPGGLLINTNGAAAPDLVSLNAHADHNRFEPAAGAGFLTAADVAAASQSFGNRLVFSMGCHAGLSVFDAFVPTNNLDWAQLFAQKGAAAYVANTGYGYGDSATIAYSEDLNKRFAESATAGFGSAGGGNLTIGEALTVAKQAYKGDLGIVGVYDEKAMAELTFYGLPMYRIGGSGIVQSQATAQAATAARLQSTAAPTAQPAPEPPASFPTDPSTGLHVESFTADHTFPATPTHTPRGDYFPGSDGVIVEHFRPIEPKAIEPVTIAQAHGALITELSSHDISPFDPVYARPIVDSSAAEPEVGFDDLAFPSKLQAVTTFKRLRETKQQVVLAQGQFFSNSPSDGSGSGTQRLFTHEAGRVFSSASQDFAPPVFTSISAQKIGTTAVFSVDVSDLGGPVKRVLVAFKDQSPGDAWQFLDLAQSAPGSTHWAGSSPVNGPFQFFDQAVDPFGNVAVSTNKGLYYEAAPPPTATGGVAVATTVNPPASGWFTSDANVQVTIDGQPPQPGAATLSIDGGAPELYDNPVTVTGDGPHTATAVSANGSATTVFLIDESPPTITFTTPANGLGVPQGSQAPPVFSCSDAGIGVDTCTPSAFDTTNLGFHTFTVDSADKIGGPGHTTTKSVTYAVIKITSPADGASFQRSTSAGSSFACGSVASCTADVTQPDGTHVAVSSGQPIPTGQTGSYTFAVTSTDAAGDSATLTQSYSVTPSASLAGKIVFTRTNHIWAINPDGTGLTQLTTGAVFDDQPTKSPDGNRVVFARRTSASGPAQLFVMDADGANLKQLTSAGDNTAPAWSPDGQKIAFQSNRTGSKGIDVWVGTWNAALQNPLFNLVNLTNTAGDDTAPAWSPTATGRIAFASTRSGNSDIFTMTTTGGSVTQLTKDKSIDREPSWSPDGSKITFSSNRATTGTPYGFEIYVMGASTGQFQTRLTTIAGDDTAPVWLDASNLLFSSASFQGGGLAKVAQSGGAVAKVTNTLPGDSNPAT